MIDILKTSDSLCKTWLKSLIEENNAEIIMEILLDGKDKTAQKHVSRVIKYLLCRMKIIEKDEIKSNSKEEYKHTFTDTDGNEHT